MEPDEPEEDELEPDEPDEFELDFESEDDEVEEEEEPSDEPDEPLSDFFAAALPFSDVLFAPSVLVEPERESVR